MADKKPADEKALQWKRWNNKWRTQSPHFTAIIEPYASSSTDFKTFQSLCVFIPSNNTVPVRYGFTTLRKAKAGAAACISGALDAQSAEQHAQAQAALKLSNAYACEARRVWKDVRERKNRESKPV